MTPEEIIPQIVEATKAIQSNPDDVAALKRRACLFIEMNMLDEAQDDLSHIIDTLHIADADAYRLRGSIRMKQGDKDGAYDDMKKLVSLKPELFEHLSGEYASQKSSGHC